MRVILISGRAGSGKDTAAKIMKSCFEQNYDDVLITHYADLLKYICRDYFDWDGNKDEYGRTLLQHIGTDVVRKKKPDFWVDFIADILDFFHDYWDVVIIPDVRFPNEITRLQKRGYLTTHLHILRPSYTNTLTKAQKSHESENAMSNIKSQFCIENSGDLNELKEKITNWVKENFLND